MTVPDFSRHDDAPRESHPIPGEPIRISGGRDLGHPVRPPDDPYAEGPVAHLNNALAMLELVKLTPSMFVSHADYLSVSEAWQAVARRIERAKEGL